MKKDGVRNKHRTRELGPAVAAHLPPRVVGGPGDELGAPDFKSGACTCGETRGSNE
jgi:hypothetical protein